MTGAGNERYWLPLSADSPGALERLRHASAEAVRSRPDLTPADLLRSVRGRRPRAWRAVAVAATVDELAATLAGAGDSEQLSGTADAARSDGAWLLPDVGEVDGRRLYEHARPFRAVLDRVCGRLAARWDVDVRTAVLDVATPRAPEAAALARAVLGLGYAETWRACAGPPAVVAGAGAGVPLALSVAGALAEADALDLVATLVQLAADRASLGLEALAAAVETFEWKPLIVPLVRLPDGATLERGRVPEPDDVVAMTSPLGSIDALRTSLATAPIAYVVELGPRPDLPANGTPSREPPRAIAVRQDGRDPFDGLLHALAQAFCAGGDVDLGALSGDVGRATLRLPAPPLEGRRIWPEAVRSAAPEPPREEPQPAAGREHAVGSATLAAIVEHVSVQLGLDPEAIDAEATFLDLGADSLALVNLLAQVRKAFDVRIGMRELFEDASSSVRLAELIDSRLPGAGAGTDVAEPPPAAPAPQALPAAVREAFKPPAPPTPSHVDFSVYFFGSYPRETPPEERYELVLESARFADEAGFHAIWIPERHFHAFGGIFPNPALLAATLARETRRIRLHAGSVVLPLHHPIRVAEEWAVVDNLSGGRVGIGVASGWHANDFAFNPAAYGRHKDVMYEGLETVEALWRGQAVETVSGSGERIEVVLHPPPLQARPPLFTAVLGNPDSYRRAGERDLGVITNLMTQDVESLTENIVRYREARAAAGLDPSAGRVVVLLHTYLAETEEQARAEAYEPFCEYLRSSLSLFGQVTNSLGMNIDLEHTPEEDLQYLLRRAFENYCDARALIGTVDSAQAVARRLVAAGANEIACFVDFGVSLPQVRRSLPQMDELRRRFAVAEPCAQVDDVAPLALAQERIWFVEKLLEGQRGYNEPQVIRFEGALDPGAFEAALNDVVRTQTTLRCHVVEAGGIPSQCIHPYEPIAVAVTDAGGRDEDVVAVEEMAREAARDFDLTTGPLWFARLVRLGPELHLFVLSCHHLVLDMLATRCFTRELSRCYAARLRGEVPAPPSEHHPYGDYARQQREALTSPEVQAAGRYWSAQLTPLPRPLELPADRPRPTPFMSEGATIFHSLDGDAAVGIDVLCHAAQVTPFMVLTGAFALTLAGVCDRETILLGTPVADQPLGFANTIGIFINMLPLTVDLRGAGTFEQILARVRTTMVDALEHTAAPFEDVVRRVNPPRDPSRNPIFQVTIEYGAGAAYEFTLPGILATPLPVATGSSPFDLTLHLWRSGERFDCQFEYATALFDRATIARLVASFDAVVRAVVAQPDAPLDDVLRSTRPNPAAATLPPAESSPSR